VSRTTRALTVPLAAGLSAAALSAGLLVTPAAAAPPSGVGQVDLVTGSKPEGIAAGPAGTFFAGARTDGAIYSGDVRTGTLTPLVPGAPGSAAVGLFYDDRSGLLWVAGGGPGARTGTGTVTAYRGSTAIYTRTIAGAGFLNDVVVTERAVYFTDSFRAALVVVPLGADGAPAGEPFLRSLGGEYVQPAGFGANGIRELPTGDLVLVSGGVLYAVDPVTGVADVIEVRGRQLTAGDGLVLDGSTLYVVNGYGGDEVAVLRLSADATRAQAVGVIRSAALDRPTTGALVDGSLYVVNGRFDTLATTPDAPVYVTRLRTR
jgi:streptogramin lyase